MNEVEKWYQEIDVDVYQKALYELTPRMLVDEFQEVNGLFESTVVDQRKVGELYAAIEIVLLERLK